MVNTRLGKKSKAASTPKGKGKASSSSPPAKKQKSVVLPISEKSKLSSPKKVIEPEDVTTQAVKSQKSADSGNSSHSTNSKSIAQISAELISEKGDEGKTSKSRLQTQESMEVPTAKTLPQSLLVEEAVATSKISELQTLVATKENIEATKTPVVTQVSPSEEISSQPTAVTPVATQPEKAPIVSNVPTQQPAVVISSAIDQNQPDVQTQVATPLATPTTQPSKKSAGQSSKQTTKKPMKATAVQKAKGASTSTTPTPGYNIHNAFAPWYYTKEIAASMNVYGQCQFIPERNINPKSFLSTGMLKAIEDQGWNNTVFKNKGFVSRVVQEFYANITDGFDESGSITYHKIFVRNHIYNFSPQVISDFLGVPLRSHDEFEKEFDEDMVATELLGTNRTWPKEDVLQVTDLTLKYRGLHRIAMHNWRPTTHYPTIHFDFASFLYDVGISVPVNLGQLIFEQICDLRNLKYPKKRSIFPSLIYGILSKQKPLMYDSEFLTATPSNIVFKLKEKDPVEGELDAAADVGTQGPVVTAADVTTSTDQAARLTRIEKMVAAIAKKLDVDMEDV